METIITGKRIEITDAIGSYAKKAVARLPRYYDLVTDIQINCEKVDSHSFQVELLIHTNHAEKFIAKHKHEDLYAAIDGVTDKMERQLTDHKEKLRDNKH